jgi:hypothetical protein
LYCSKFQLSKCTWNFNIYRKKTNSTNFRFIICFDYIWVCVYTCRVKHIRPLITLYQFLRWFKCWNQYDFFWINLNSVFNTIHKYGKGVAFSSIVQGETCVSLVFQMKLIQFSFQVDYDFIQYGNLIECFSNFWRWFSKEFFVYKIFYMFNFEEVLWIRKNR